MLLRQDHTSQNGDPGMEESDSEGVPSSHGHATRDVSRKTGRHSLARRLTENSMVCGQVQADEFARRGPPKHDGFQGTVHASCEGVSFPANNSLDAVRE